MIFFRRPKHYRPTLNMASMPDLIFTILFFFILVTRMREVTLKVKYTTPEGTEITQQAKKHDVIHIYIGPPANWMQRFAGRNTHIQINDKYRLYSRKIPADDARRAREHDCHDKSRPPYKHESDNGSKASVEKSWSTSHKLLCHITAQER